MDHVSLHKKLSTFVTDKGYFKNVSDDVLYEVLVAWENWTGTSKEFYRSIGFSFPQMAGLIGKAKKLKREGHFGAAEFKAVHVEGATGREHGSDTPCPGVEMVLQNGRTIRFSGVDLLVDFLKKSA